MHREALFETKKFPSCILLLMFLYEILFRPLEKGQKIKERFDAIFGITEYNKCLDHFRALSKDMDSSM